MNHSRRTFLSMGAAAAGLVFRPRSARAGGSHGPPPGFESEGAIASPIRDLSGLKLGVTDWNLRRTGQVEAVELSARLGFRGVEVSLGRDVDGNEGRLPLDDPEKQEAYLRAFEAHDVEIAGTCLDRLHDNYLKNDPLGQRWVADGIPITRKLNAKVMLIPFFGAGALETREEMDFVADFMREIGPEAEREGVILGLENTISAEDNVRILERAGSPAVLVYYDVGNSINQGFNIYEEIRWLGGERICQFHLKDNPHYLGEGDIDFREVMQAISEIDYAGFANFETSSPSNDVEADMRRNLSYLRSIKREIG